MTSCSCVLPRVDPSFHFPTKNPRSCSPPAATAAAFRSQSKQMDGVVLPRNKSQTLGVWANANEIQLLKRTLLRSTFLKKSRVVFVNLKTLISASRGKRFSSDDVIMVDPLEAKRLAAKQMQEIQTKQKLKRQRQIEAINGAWAMIGLTAGLVIEGQTGESMLGQLAGYWSAIVSFFSRWHI